jgi:hypothetical protein
MRLTLALMLLLGGPATAKAPPGPLEAGWMGTRVCCGTERPRGEHCTLVTADLAQHQLGDRQVLVASGSPPPDAGSRRGDATIAVPLILLPIRR